MINIDELENRCANALLAAAGSLPIMTLASYRIQETMARPKSSVRAITWGFISSVALGAIWGATPWARDEPSEKDEAEVLKSYQPKILMSIANEVSDDVKETMDDYAYKIADEAGKKRMRADRFETILWGDRFNREHIEALHDSERRKDLRDRLMRVDAIYGEDMFQNYEAAADRYYDLPEWRWLDGGEDTEKKERSNSYYNNPYLTNRDKEKDRPVRSSVFSYKSPSNDKKVAESRQARTEDKPKSTTRYLDRWSADDDDDDDEVITVRPDTDDIVDRLLGNGYDPDFEDQS